MPDIARRPVRKGAELAHDHIRLHGKVVDYFQLGTAARLLAAQAGKPHLVPGNGFEEWLYFAKAAAAVRLGNVEFAEDGLLLGDGLPGQQIMQIDAPIPGDAIAIFVGLLKVVAGVKEEHRDFRLAFTHKIQQQHIFSLEAAG